LISLTKRSPISRLPCPSPILRTVSSSAAAKRRSRRLLLSKKGRIEGDFLKEVPLKLPQELSKKRKRRLSRTDSPISVWGKKLRYSTEILQQEAGPLPHLLHDIRIIFTNFAFFACRACCHPLKHALRKFNQISSFAMQRGNAKEGPGGNGRLHFLGYFFLERERSNTKAGTPSARSWARPSAKL